MAEDTSAIVEQRIREAYERLTSKWAKREDRQRQLRENVRKKNEEQRRKDRGVECDHRKQRAKEHKRKQREDESVSSFNDWLNKEELPRRARELEAFNKKQGLNTVRIRPTTNSLLAAVKLWISALAFMRQFGEQLYQCDGRRAIQAYDLLHELDVRELPVAPRKPTNGWTIEAEIAALETIRDALVIEISVKPSDLPRSNKGGRPRDWERLWELIQEADEETDEQIAKNYNKRFGAPIKTGKRKKATTRIVRDVRYSYGKRAKSKQHHK